MVKWLSQGFVVPLLRVQFPLAAPPGNHPEMGGFLFVQMIVWRGMNRLELVEFKTEDGLTLPGLLHDAGGDEVMIYLHGNGSSSVFYDQGEVRLFAEALAKKGVSSLFFNNRGAHLIKMLTRTTKGESAREFHGMAFEKIKDCVHDIDGAISFLKDRGYTELSLMGVSTGANKICVYHHYKPDNEIKRNVLICGGDDAGTYYDLFGEEKFKKLLQVSDQKISNGNADELATELLTGMIISYGSLKDILNPDGDYYVFPFLEALTDLEISTKPLFRHYASVKSSSLVVYGDQDEYVLVDIKKVIDRLKEHQPEFSYKIIDGANHVFSGKEAELADTITNWL